MQNTIEQSVDDFLASECTTDRCIVVWDCLVDELQNGDQDKALAGTYQVVAAMEKAQGCWSLSHQLKLAVLLFGPLLRERELCGASFMSDIDLAVCEVEYYMYRMEGKEKG